jgi:hypothetical protein
MSRFLATHKAAAALLAGAVLLPLGGMAWAYTAFRGIKEPLILRFTATQGITEVGTFATVLMLGVFWVLVCVVNAAIAAPLLERDKFLGRFLIGANIAVSILIFIWFAAIISVN